MIKYGATYLININAPAEEFWREDLADMQRHGFNTIKALVVWEDCEPREGEFHFEPHQRFLALCDAVGMNVIVEIRDKNAGFPRWFSLKYPESMPVMADGRRRVNGACYNHPAYQAAVTRFYEKTAQALTGFKSLQAWDIWNECHLNSAGDLGRWGMGDLTCFCEHCDRGYIEWRQHHPEHRRLLTNDGWCGIDDPTLPPLRDRSDYRWRLYYVDEVMPAEARRRYDAVRRYDPRPIGLHDVYASPWGNPVAVGNDDWRLAACVDVYGITSSGPSALAEDIDAFSYWLAPFVLDATRSAANGKEWWLSEWHVCGHGHSGSFCSRRHRDFNAIKREYFEALTRGATGFFAWAYRTFSDSFCLKDARGRSVPAYEHMTRITQALQAANHFTPQPLRKPDVAILFDPENVLKLWDRTGSAALHNTATEALYRYLYDSNFMIDFVHPSTLDRLSQYRAVFTPAPMGYGPEVRDALREYVRGGGTLISEAFFGYIDGEAMARTGAPPHGFQEVFGLEVTDVSSPTPCHTLPVTTPEGSPMVLHFLNHYEPLTLSTARPLLLNTADGVPTAAINRFGKGQALYLAAQAWSELSPIHAKMICGAGGEISTDGGGTGAGAVKNYDIMDYLLQQAGLNPASAKGVRVDRYGQLLIVQNQSTQAYPWKPEQAVTDLFTDQTHPVGNVVDIRPRATEVFRLNA